MAAQDGRTCAPSAGIRPTRIGYSGVKLPVTSPRTKRTRPSCGTARGPSGHQPILPTMAEVSSERNSTLIFSLPMEVLRLVGMLRQPDAAQGTARLAQA